MSAGTSGPVDEFENYFQACLAALTNPDHFNVRDSEEVKTGVEQTIQRFLDVAKNMECFFLQKRLLLSVQEPEHILKENISELKSELARKEQLLNKYYEKIPTWQSLLQDVPGGTARLLPPPPQNVVSQPQPNMNQGPPMPNTVPPQPPPGMQAHPHHMIPPHCMPQQPMPSAAAPSGGMGMPNPQMQHPQSHMAPGQQPGGLQGPLAFLERTMSNIGMPEGGR